MPSITSTRHAAALCKLTLPVLVSGVIASSVLRHRCVVMVASYRRGRGGGETLHLTPTQPASPNTAQGRAELLGERPQ